MIMVVATYQVTNFLVFLQTLTALATSFHALQPLTDSISRFVWVKLLSDINFKPKP
ncbi:hypothetical protein HanPSC8_Chr01g0008341 [Helianthus annuus]|nr:hypothetical protein HanPSC8_Chr01g0008341 [Helianthus annuus]